MSLYLLGNHMSELEILFEKYYNNECTPSEVAIIEDYIYNNKSQPNEIPYDLLKHNEEQLRKVILKIPFSERQTLKLWQKLTGVAVALIAVISTIYFFDYKPDAEDSLIAMSNITPGTNKATLTLANGKSIQLSTVKTGVVIGASNLKYNDGTELDSSSQPLVPLSGGGGKGSNVVSEAVLTTPRGGQYQIILPDGTQVWLNSASTLKFSTSFVGQLVRRVVLDGEAYFEVAKDPRHPFLVRTSKQEVKVLGTHFNVKSYKDEKSTKTTLLEGSVQINSLLALSTTGRNIQNIQGSSADARTPDQGSLRKEESYGVTLKPNQESVLVANEFKVLKVDPAESVAWRNGYFQFDEENIESIMREFARWYNIDVVYVGGIPQGTFRGQLSKSKSLKQALTVLNLSGITYRLEGRRLIIQTE